jgi:hypothetical protein
MDDHQDNDEHHGRGSTPVVDIPVKSLLLLDEASARGRKGYLSPDLRTADLTTGWLHTS